MIACAACGSATRAHPDAIFAGVVPDPSSAAGSPFPARGIAGAASAPLAGAGDHLLNEGARDRQAQLLRSEVKGIHHHTGGTSYARD